MFGLIVAAIVTLSGDVPPPPGDPNEGLSLLTCRGEREVYNDGSDTAQWYSRREPWEGRLWIDPNGTRWRTEGMAETRPVVSRDGPTVTLAGNGQPDRTTLDLRTGALVSRGMGGRLELQANCRGGPG